MDKEVTGPRGVCYTPVLVADMLGGSRARVWQVERTVLRQLRARGYRRTSAGLIELAP